MRPRTFISVLVSVALVLSGCSSYKVTLQGEDHFAYARGEPMVEPRPVTPTGEPIDPGQEVAPPVLVVEQQIIEGDPRTPVRNGFARVRFEVSETGAVTNARIIDVGVGDVSAADQQGFEAAALQLIESWQITPGSVDGRPVAFADVETVMRFDEIVSQNELFGASLATVVVITVLAVAAGVSFTYAH